MKEKTYRINEIFYSLQGEGMRSGTANIFIRFSGCNLKCSKDDKFSGFDCDTEFASGVNMTVDQIIAKVSELWPANQTAQPPAIIFTGGEPGLQLDDYLVQGLKSVGWFLAVETNGTYLLSRDLDWVCCSPKSAEHTLVVATVHELKYVRHAGQGIPKPLLKASFYLISPAFNPDWSVAQETLQHCIKLVKENPKWRLSVQQHKLWGIR